MKINPTIWRWRFISFFVLLALAFYDCSTSSAVYGQCQINDIPVPAGYSRVQTDPESFPAWLKALPLKPRNEILLHNGQILTSHHYNILAVVDKPLLFQIDLEQCIDFCLRLWADYHYEQGLLQQLYLFNHEGEKVYFSVPGSETSFPDTGRRETRYLDFLKFGMAWTNPYSVFLGAKKISPAEVRPGDCVLQTVGIYRGQASMILDECNNGKGERLFLIGFGFSPAQEFHIEKAPPGFGHEGWFSLEHYFRYLKLNYAYFGNPVLIRF